MIRRFAALLMLVVLGVVALPIATFAETGGALKPNTVEWYCHEGALLLHAGQKYSEGSTPFKWSVDDLLKANADFTECYNIATRQSNRGWELIAASGKAMADTMLAESLHANEVLSYPHTSIFLSMHKFALRYASLSLEACNISESLIADIDWSDSASEFARVSDAVRGEKRAAASIQKIVRGTTIENVPRNLTEVIAWARMGRIPSYHVIADWGLTSEETCRTKSTPISWIEGAAEYPGLTGIGISIKVSSNGTLLSAHIVQSSGNEDADETALTAVWHFKYIPATKKCDPVNGSTVIWF